MIVKNILLTGASSGIGEALALYYAKQPETENIFICGRNQQRLQAVKEVCEKAGTAKIHARILDVTNRHAGRNARKYFQHFQHKRHGRRQYGYPCRRNLQKTLRQR